MEEMRLNYLYAMKMKVISFFKTDNVKGPYNEADYNN